MRMFKIQGEYDDHDGFLYWSNVLGWVDYDSATEFEATELYHINLPIGTTGIAIMDETNTSTLEQAFDKLKEYYEPRD